MPDPIVEGQPLVLGQINDGEGRDDKYFLARVLPDGTRRIAEGRFDDPGFNAYLQMVVKSGETVAEDQVGLIPVRVGRAPTVRAWNPLLQENDFEEGVWMGYGPPWVFRVPVTPGDDFYRFRRHVGQAADHFDARFVPAKINQRKATAHRLYEIAQELDPGDRDKVGNVSLKERSDSGYLWRRLHALRTMPFGTPDTRHRCGAASVDRMDILLHAHCDRCARIIDVALSHP